MTKRVIEILAIWVVVAVLLSGCVSLPAVNGDKFFVHYAKHEKFVTRIPLVLMYVDAGQLGRHLALVVPAGVSVGNPAGLYAGPPIDDIHGPPYCAGEDSKFCAWEPADVIEAVAAGTEITVSRMRRKIGYGFMYGVADDLIPMAMIRSKTKGNVEVDISDLSIFNVDEAFNGGKFDIPKPNSEVIKQE